MDRSALFKAPKAETKEDRQIIMKAIETWMDHKCDATLKLLLSGAATRPAVKRAFNILRSNDPNDSNDFNPIMESGLGQCQVLLTRKTLHVPLCVFVSD
jgi:hypothetical protein